MKASAKERYVRIAPRKLRQVAELIKGVEVGEALGLLQFSPKGGARVLFKLVTAAQANALQGEGSRSDTLYVRNAVIDQGPVLKRLRPRARGSRDIIKKRTSHVTVMVDNGTEEN